MEVLTKRRFQPGGSWGGAQSTCQLLYRTRRWRTRRENATRASAGWCRRQRWRDCWVTHTTATWWIVCKCSQVSFTSQLRPQQLSWLNKRWRAGGGTLRGQSDIISEWDVVMFSTVRWNRWGDGEAAACKEVIRTHSLTDTTDWTPPLELWVLSVMLMPCFTVCTATTKYPFVLWQFVPTCLEGWLCSQLQRYLSDYSI